MDWIHGSKTNFDPFKEEREVRFDSAVDSVDVTLLVENSVDMLIPSEPNVRRVGLYEHVKPASQAMLCENGIAYLIDVTKGGRHHVILFDTGLTGIALIHNLARLGRSPDEITHAVISHGHPDHYGGLVALLEKRANPLPVAIHPAAFVPRYVYGADGNVVPVYNHGLAKDELERKGVIWVLAKEPILLAAGVATTGFIPAAVPFEPPIADPGTGATLWMVQDGALVADSTPDDQAVCINIAGVGLLVLTGCAHAGVVSSTLRAMDVTGVETIYGIMGGFHLGFPGVSEERSQLTVEKIKSLKPSLVCPMHCTGVHAISLFYNEMRGQFLRTSTGTRLSVSSDSQWRGSTMVIHDRPVVSESASTSGD